MTFLIALIDTLMIGYLFASGLFCSFIFLSFVVGKPLTPEEIGFMVTDLITNQSPYLWAMTGFVFLLLSYLSVLLRRKRSLTPNDLIYTSPKGNEIQISNKAITEFINKIVNSIDGVHSASARIYSNKNKSKVIIKINLSIWEGTSYPEINSNIQEAIRSKMSEEMGVEKITSIPVSLDKIVTKKPPVLPEEEENLIQE